MSAVELPQEFVWDSVNPRAKPHGSIKEAPEDFRVKEILGRDLSGEGEHTYLLLEKWCVTTTEVQAILATHYGVPLIDVAYAGLKDRNAVTQQWFSVRLPNTNDLPKHPNFNVLARNVHHKKLRHGDTRGNSFEVTIRSVDHVPTSLLAEPIPNYFGLQRFGRDFNNIPKAMAWIHDRSIARNRFTKSLYISTLRAWLFNEVLSRRVRDNSWLGSLDGEVLRNGVATGPLWGRGQLSSQSEVREVEESALARFDEIRNALEWVGLKQDRRVLSISATEVSVEKESNICIVKFTLPTGSYATIALNEYFELG